MPSPQVLSHPVRSTLKVLASTGALSHEAGITIRGIDGTYESFVDSELVNPENGEPLTHQDKRATIAVNVIKVDNGNVLIELPRQVVVGGRRIWVPASEVQ
jgi:hypothetical protein